MSKGLALIQEGLASLGYDPGPADGLIGPRTREAVRNALAADFAPKSKSSGGKSSTGLKRIIWHWTAGRHAPSAIDREHYHFIIAGSGDVVRGDKTPEDNLSTSDGVYAEHTGGANTGAIGVAVAGMLDAMERPFSAGPFPITDRQINALIDLSARLCRQYGIPVSPETTLSHAEVERTLGIPQRQKWDITWLPHMNAPGDAIAIGNILRGRLSHAMKTE